MEPLLDKEHFSSVKFAILGILVENALPQSELAKQLVQLGWTQGEDRNTTKELHASARSLFVQLEKAGLVTATEVKGYPRFYSATRAGYEFWRRSFDFCNRAVDRWAALRNRKRAEDFIALADPRAFEPKAERVATPEEKKLLLQHANRPLYLIYEFSNLCNVRTTDLMNAQIEKINWADKQLGMEYKAMSGSVIDTPIVNFGPEAEQLLKEAVGDRTSGPVFRSVLGRQWNSASLTFIFRTARAKAGLPDTIVMSGRGGNIGRRAVKAAAKKAKKQVEEVDE